MTRTAYAIASILLTLCVALSTWAPAARAGESPRPADRVEADDPIDAVARAIAHEARDHWKEAEGWPRDESTYADDHPDALTSAQALDALQRELFDHPALDGYVKRQLLGYVSDSDLSHAPRDSIVRAFRVLPQVINQPQPQVRSNQSSSSNGLSGAYIFIGRQVPYIAGFTPVVGDGVVRLKPDIEVLTTGTALQSNGAVTMDRQFITTIRAASSELVNLRRFTSKANEPILDLREALAARIDDPPLKLALMLDDASDRMKAGDPSYEEAIDRFVSATDRFRRSRELPVKTRRKLIEHLDKLSGYEKKWTREIEIIDAETFQAHHATVAWPAEKMKRAMLNLRGENPGAHGRG